MTGKKVSNKNRKFSVLVGFTQGEIIFLDRKVNKNFQELKSRSAIIRMLVNHAMLHPELLEVAWTKGE